MEKTTFISGMIATPGFFNELQDTVLSEIQERTQANTALSDALNNEIENRRTLNHELDDVVGTLNQADITENQRALAAEAVANTTYILLDVKDAVSNAMTASLSAAKGHACVIVLDSTGVNSTTATTQTLTITGVLSAGRRVDVINRCGGLLLVAGGSMDRGIADSGLIPSPGQACLMSDGTKYYLDSIDKAVADLRASLSSFKQVEMIATAPKGDVIIPNGTATSISQLRLPAGKWAVSGVATTSTLVDSADVNSGASIFVWLSGSDADATSPGGNPVGGIYLGTGVSQIGNAYPLVPREFDLASPAYVYVNAYHSGGSHSSFCLRSLVLDVCPLS